jgi:hypothetical protein
MSSRTFAPALILCIASACVLSVACADSTPRRQALALEAPPPAPETAATPASSEAARAHELPPPDAAEVSGVVERIFKGAVTVGAASAPAFAVGDFNGDDSQDLAVAVAPAPGKLGEINDELAGWIIKDPFAPPPEGSTAYGAARRRILVEEADTLLAVIHGFGAEGWRDARATQTYVLKDAVGERMRSRVQKAALAAGEEGKMPRLVGDVIDETVGGRAGFLYYNGAHYLWYDPRGYKPPPPTRVVHGGAVKSVQQ